MGNFHEEGIAGLRSMEESSLLTRKVYAEVPPRAEYTLTKAAILPAGIKKKLLREMQSLKAYISRNRLFFFQPAP